MPMYIQNEPQRTKYVHTSFRPQCHVRELRSLYRSNVRCRSHLVSFRKLAHPIDDDIFIKNLNESIAIMRQLSKEFDLHLCRIRSLVLFFWETVCSKCLIRHRNCQSMSCQASCAKFVQKITALFLITYAQSQSELAETIINVKFNLKAVVLSC